MRRAWLGMALLVVLVSPASAKKEKLPGAPDWVAAAMEGEVATDPKDAAVILLSEVRIEPADRLGRNVRRRHRQLLRILASEGLPSEVQTIYYSSTRKLTWFGAWTIRPDGSVQEVDKKQVVDVSESTFKEFKDTRRRVLPMPNVGVGSMVALEYVVEESDSILQDVMRLQAYYPVALFRLVLELPDPWEYEATFHNIGPREPEREGGRLTWEFRNLPGLKGTAYSAPRGDTAAAMALSYHPPGRFAEDFRQWTDVASWADGLVAPQAAGDDALRQAVAALALADADRIAKIRAIAREVQDLRYVHVSLGRSGYVPYPAAEVLARRYGDCKDKATLMMTMLREAGLASHPVLVETRDSGRVFSDFPSPRQFNHMILAIPVESEMPATTTHPELGPLLFFDPTDDRTPVGDLPWSDQGTTGLLVHSEHGSLVKIPELPAASNRVERSWTLAIDSSGHADVSVAASFTGQYAGWMRSRFSTLPDAERREAVAASLSRLAPGARLEELGFHDLDAPEQPVRVEISVAIPRFGRLAGSLRLLRPFALVESFAPVLPEDPGGLPALLPFRFQETDRIALRVPESWRVSERPEDVTLETGIGRASFRYHETDEGWELERELLMQALEVPLDDYDDSRAFLEEVARAGAATLVLELGD